MKADSEAIFDAALHLPEAERLALISRLLETLPPDDTGISLDDPDFAQEMDRRFADREGAVSWPELRSER